MEQMSTTKKHYETVRVLQEHGRALQRLLKTHWDPHCTIIVTPEAIQIVRDELRIPATRNLDDLQNYTKQAWRMKYGQN